MKNALLILFAVVAVGLGFLYYKSTKPTWRSAGTKHQRKDHNQNTVNTEECPTLLGVKKDVCVIPISYLQGMMPAGGQTDITIEVHPNDTIVWLGDHGESIDKVEMPKADCSGHAQSTKRDNEEPLIDTLSGSGNLRFAHVSGKDDHLGYCYKTTVWVTLNGKQAQIDPHTFDGPDTP